jgi:hypothetical protein
MHAAQVLDDEEWEEYLKKLAEEKNRHPEKFLPKSRRTSNVSATGPRR